MPGFMTTLSPPSSPSSLETHSQHSVWGQAFRQALCTTARHYVQLGNMYNVQPVSYTHLTLPTILLV